MHHHMLLSTGKASIRRLYLIGVKSMHLQVEMLAISGSPVKIILMPILFCSLIYMYVINETNPSS